MSFSDIGDPIVQMCREIIIYQTPQFLQLQLSFSPQRGGYLGSNLGLNLISFIRGNCPKRVINSG